MTNIYRYKTVNDIIYGFEELSLITVPQGRGQLFCDNFESWHHSYPFEQSIRKKPDIIVLRREICPVHAARVLPKH